MQSRQSIELRQQQRLALTPQLQQAIRLLQFSAHDLEQEVAHALLDNPLLERQEEYATDGGDAEPAATPEAPEFVDSVGISQKRMGPDDDYERPEAAPAPDLRRYLHDQARLTRVGDRDRVLLGLLIDELDDNGYLSTPLPEMVQLLPPELDIGLDEWRAALRLLQSFEPAGVGAVTLSECLLLQLQRCETNVAQDVMECARTVARDYLSLLATGNLTRVRRELGCTLDVLQQARQLLLTLDPKPGRAWTHEVSDYVRPEVIVRKAGKQWRVYINPAAVPQLRVNTEYERIIRESPEPVLHKQLQQAHGLIKGIHQRYETILRVAEAVLARQQDFLAQGERALRPLILRDIAQELEMHESTVSRATRLKYAQTPRGVFELKSFFTTAIARDDGDSTSAAAVRSLVQELIEDEPTAKPLSDNRIATMLAERGVVIARRTVTKYRESLGIPAASLRRARTRLDESL